MVNVRLTRLGVFVLASCCSVIAGEESEVCVTSEETSSGRALLQRKRSDASGGVITGQELNSEFQALLRSSKRLAAIRSTLTTRFDAGYGNVAPLTEQGFWDVVGMYCPMEMERWFNRLIGDLGFKVCSKPHVQGLMHWFIDKGLQGLPGAPVMNYQYAFELIRNGNPCKYWAPIGESCPSIPGGSDKCAGHWCGNGLDVDPDEPPAQPTGPFTFPPEEPVTPVTLPPEPPATEAPAAPTEAPAAPTEAPVFPSLPPTEAPPVAPTEAPAAPTETPAAPTEAPAFPSLPPTEAPVLPPTEAPVLPPTEAPPVAPTEPPAAPTEAPAAPTEAPAFPSLPPTEAPVLPPTEAPPLPPTLFPTEPPIMATEAPPTETPPLPPAPLRVLPPTELPVMGLGQQGAGVGSWSRKLRCHDCEKGGAATEWFKTSDVAACQAACDLAVSKIAAFKESPLDTGSNCRCYAEGRCYSQSGVCNGDIYAKMAELSSLGPSPIG